MSPTRFPKPQRPNKDVSEKLEPSARPVQPEDGPVSGLLPDEPGTAGSAHPSRQKPKSPRTMGPVGRQQAPSPRGAIAPLSAAGLALPHERDESAETPARTPDKTPDPMMDAARHGIDAGLVDTAMHATPGLDAEIRERMVPGPGGKRPPSAP